MKVLLFTLYLLLTTTRTFCSDGSEMISEEESRKIIKKELQNLAHNYQTTLTSQISNLESEMFMEFLRFTDDINLSRISFSEAVQQNLSISTTDVFTKLGKVMMYSAYMIQTLNDRLSDLQTSLGDDKEEEDGSLHKSPTSILSTIQDQILEILSSTSIEVDYGRRRRHVPHFTSQPNSLPSRLLILQELTYDKIFGSGDPTDEPLTPPDITLAANIDLLGAQMDLGSEPGGNGKAEGVNDSESEMPAGAVEVGEETVERVMAESEEIEEEKVGREMERLPRDCLDLLLSGHTHDRMYTIYPEGGDVGVEVLCDQGSDGGGWTVLVARTEHDHQPRFNFTRPSTYYSHGFGHPKTEYWIGLEHMAAITRGVNSTLRVQLTDSHDHHFTNASAIYHTFSVGEGADGYVLTVGGYDEKESNAGDALTPHSGRPFSFPGGSHGKDCADNHGVGWWFVAAPECYQTLPTGRFNHTGQEGGLVWGVLAHLTSIQLTVRRKLD